MTNITKILLTFLLLIPLRLCYQWTWIGDPIATQAIGFIVYVDDSQTKIVDINTNSVELLFYEPGRHKIEATAYGPGWETQRSIPRYVSVY